MSEKERLKNRQIMKIGVKFGQKRSHENGKKINKLSEKKAFQVSYFVILQAIVLKYSYLLALLMIYLISFYTVNLIHVILVALFLIFFSRMNSTITLPNPKVSAGLISKVIEHQSPPSNLEVHNHLNEKFLKGEKPNKE